MPYIPPQNRPAIDAAVNKLANALADEMIRDNRTAGVSELYRREFMIVARTIHQRESGKPADATGPSAELAAVVIDVARAYQQQGGWLGELNYAVTRLIQGLPFAMYNRGVWKEALRYWLYAETVGALVRTGYELHEQFGNDWIANGLAGVFEDVKDEYKRRVNTAYEAAQIRKSGDCYEMSPFRTQLVEFQAGGAQGYLEILLPQQTPTQR